MRFIKILSANDVGKTNSHQAGILIPKSQPLLINALGPLDNSILNPRASVKCVDELGIIYKFNFIYYNNKLLVQGGTRNEYRLTGMTKYLNNYGASEGDELVLAIDQLRPDVSIQIIKRKVENAGEPIKLSGWRVIH